MPCSSRACVWISSKMCPRPLLRVTHSQPGHDVAAPELLHLSLLCVDNASHRSHAGRPVRSGGCAGSWRTSVSRSRCRSLLYDTDNSLVRQSYSPRMMHTFLNLAGFGMKAWDPTSLRPDDPFTYRATSCRRSTATSAALSSKLAPTWLVAHVRGDDVLRRRRRRRDEPAPLPLRRARASCSRTTGTCVSSRGCATRCSTTCSRARAADRGHDRLGVDLRARAVAARRPLWRARRRASSPMRRPRALRILRTVRAAHEIDTSSPVNLCLAPGRTIVATRLSFDYGWYPPEDEMLETDLPFVSLWYAIGGEYREARGRVADDPRRPAALADHRLRAAHDRFFELVRGAGVLDADRRADAGRRSSSRRATSMSDRETADFLATVPLLAGRDDADSRAGALLRRRTSPPGRPSGGRVERRAS